MVSSSNVSPEDLQRARERIARSRTAPVQGFAPPPQTVAEPEEEQGTIGRVLSGFGRAFEAVDRPLVDRFDIRVPEMRGPLDEIANFALQEATRPTNLAIAFGGAGIAGRLGASGSRAARGLGAVIQPISRSSSLPARVAAEGAVSGAARLGAEGTQSLLPEDAGPIATAVSTIVGGIGGAAGAAGVIRGLSRGGTREIPELTRIVNASGNKVIEPPKLAQEVFGARQIEVGTSDLDHLINRISRGVSNTAEIDDVGLPLVREQERITRVANNIGIEESQRVGARLFEAFEFEPNRVAVNVNGTRTTIADIAAKYPEWEPFLTPAQREAMQELRVALEPYKGVLVEAGGEVGTRPDVIEGGFYVPRGNALEEGAELPKSFGRSRRGGKIASQQEAVFKSQIEGLNEGWEYTPIENTIHGYIADVGRKTADLMTVNYLKTLTNAQGEVIGKTAGDLFPPYLRAKARNLKSKISSARARTIRETAVDRVKARQEAVSGQRVQAAQRRFASARSRIPEFDPEELVEARANREAAIQDIIDITRRVRGDEIELRRAQRALDAETRAALKNIEDIENLTIRLQQLEVDRQQIFGTAYGRVLERPNRTGTRDAARAARRAEREQVQLSADAIRDLNKTIRQYETTEKLLNRKLSRTQDGIEKMASKVDEMIERGEINKDLTLNARSELVSSRRALRDLQEQESTFRSAQRELRAIEREYNRLENILKSDASAADKAAARKAQAALRYDELRDEWRDFSGEYARAKAKAQQVPDGFARINMAGLEQYSFPEEIANYLNDYLARQGPNVGKNKQWLDVLENFNNIYRSFRATLDLSGAGIQTLLGGYRRPNEWRKAIGLMARTLGDERALGKMLNDFDRGAAIPSRTLAQRGLHFSSGADEFILGGTDIQRKLMSAPGIKQANRAFGGVGDAMRVMWTDAEVKSLMAKGRSVEDIIQSGDLDRIINAVNKMTGHSQVRAGGSLGEMVLFAPRFLQSRLDTVAMASRGILPGAKVDERLAAKSMMQMIGLGVMATAAINELFGDSDIDWLSPVNSDGRYNSNFMRARIAGNDVSMFGPWDSLLRAMMLTGSGSPQDALRGMASGTVSVGWDLMSGETGIGEPTRDTAGQLAQTLGSYFVPFAGGDMLANAQRIVSGDVAGGGFATLADMTGVKAAEMTPFERLDNAARAMHNRPWSELTGKEKEEVEQRHPELVEQYDERVLQNAERGVTTSILTVERNKIDEERWDTEGRLMDALANNLISTNDFSEAINRLQRESSVMKRTLEEYLQIEFDQTIPENQALSAYYDTFSQAEIAGGIIDWDERDRLEEQLFADIAAGKYGDPSRARQMVDDRRRPTHNPAIQWFYDNKEIISDSGYYGIREEQFNRFADIASRMAGETMETYIDIERAIARAASNGDMGLEARLKLVKSRIDQQTSAARDRLRLRNPELDAALVQNNGLIPIRQRRR